jgi:hypothetical protein
VCECASTSSGWSGRTDGIIIIGRGKRRLGQGQGISLPPRCPRATRAGGAAAPAAPVAPAPLYTQNMFYLKMRILVDSKS